MGLSQGLSDVLYIISNLLYPYTRRTIGYNKGNILFDFTHAYAHFKIRFKDILGKFQLNFYESGHYNRQRETLYMLFEKSNGYFQLLQTKDIYLAYGYYLCLDFIT